MRLTQGTDRCRCAACGEHFNSTAAFDKHRVGTHGVDRRCSTPDEMRARGMVQTGPGWWVTSARPNSSLPCRNGDLGAPAAGVAA